MNAADTQNEGQSVASAASASVPGGQGGGSFQDRAFAESLLRRGMGGEGMGAFHEELLRQKQAESLRQAAALQHAQQQQQQSQQNPGAGLLQQLSESQHLSQQLQQQLSQSDIRSALASAQMRQAPQLSNADIMALARSGALPGLGGLLGGFGGGGGGGGAGNGNGFDHQRLGELEQLQNLEELERRQRMLSAGLPGHMAGGGTAAAGMPGSAQQLMAQAQAQQRAPDVARQEQPEAAAVPSAASSLAAGPSSGPSGSAMMGMSAAANAAGVGPASGDKKEQRRDPGSVVVPCRARGMPMDHNFKTAYFVIPENVRHGEELICSYFACRNAGVKFRYCSHCKVPVAKRNFRKRHRHGDNIPKGLADDDDDSMEEESAGGGDIPDGEMDDIPSQVTAKMGGQNPAMKLPAAEAPQQAGFPGAHQASTQQQLNAQMIAQLASQEAAAKQLQEQAALASLQQQVQQVPSGLNMQQMGNLLNGGGAQDAQNMLAAAMAGVGGVANGNRGALATGLASLPLGLLAQTSAVATSAASASGPPPTGEKRDQLLSARNKQWVSLMANRPYTTDSDTMSTWLMEILSVSDLTMPLPADTATPTMDGDKKLPGKTATADDDTDSDDDEEEEQEDDNDEEEETDDDEDSDDDDDEDDGEEGGGNEKGMVPNGATAAPSAAAAAPKEAKVDDAKKDGAGSDKKRPVADIADGSKKADGEKKTDGEKKSESSENTSFAAWRDRKKQKIKALPTQKNSE